MNQTGRWPTVRSGQIDSTPLTWHTVDDALAHRRTALRDSTTLARLLLKHRGKRLNRTHVGPSVEQILTWADKHHQLTGRWPSKATNTHAAGTMTWSAIDHMITRYGCGIDGVRSLAQLLQRRRGHRNPRDLEPLSIAKILRWADEFRRRTGRWPISPDGPVFPGSNETWDTIDAALRIGRRGLRGNSSLSRLLRAHRGVVYHPPSRKPPFSERQVLRWIDAHRRRTGKWPTCFSGRIVGAPGESWAGVNSAMNQGRRGFGRGMSLAKFLADHNRKPYAARTQKQLNAKQIIRWAKTHRKRTGQWPTQSSGPVFGAQAEAWNNVQTALYRGVRGLPGGSSIPKLLAPFRHQPLIKKKSNAQRPAARRTQPKRRKVKRIMWIGDMLR